MSVPDPASRALFATLRDHDRRCVPPFERVIAARATGGQRQWRGWPAGAAVIGAALALALVTRVPSPAETAPSTWSDWRSPTAVLLGAPRSSMTLGAFVSPTEALAAPFQLAPGGLR